MWGELVSQLKLLLAVFFSGWAIKMMDDWLDRDLDRIVGQANLYERLGDGLPVYMGLLLVFAVYLAPVASTTLFLSAYAAGMGHELQERYWGGWPAWMESLIAVLLGVWIDPGRFVLSLALIAIIQLADDLHDQSRDNWLGRQTLASALGRGAGTTVLVLGIMTSLLVSPVYSGMVLGCACLISRLTEGESDNGMAGAGSCPHCFSHRLRLGEKKRAPGR